MRFRELRIEASGLVSDHGVVKPSLHFRWTAHHVREIFSALLPRHYTLDGSTVVQITCGPRGSDPQYQQLLGSSRYFVEGFDFSAYAKASPTDREVHLLDLAERALCDIARRAGSDHAPVVATAEAVRDRSFRLRMEVRRLRMRVPGSPYALRVFRSLSAEHGETWVLDVTARDQVVEELVMGESPDYLDRKDCYRDAEMCGSTYVVRDNRGDETYRLECDRFRRDRRE